MNLSIRFKRNTEYQSPSVILKLRLYCPYACNKAKFHNFCWHFFEGEKQQFHIHCSLKH